MHTLLLHWQLETWTFWDGIFVIAGEEICQPLQILSLQRCGCGAVFQSSWEANGQHYIIREIIRKLQKMLFVLMKENGAEDVWSYYVPLGPDWTIFEFAPRRGFCASTSIHHFFAWDPSSSDFRFRNYVDLTAAKLCVSYFVFLLSSIIFCSFSLQITLTQCCKSLFLCFSSCWWGLPSVSLSGSPSLWPWVSRPVGSPGQAEHLVPLLRVAVTRPLQEVSVLVVSQRRPGLLQQSLAALLPW